MRITGHVRGALRRVAAEACHASGLPLHSLRGRVAVLMYHRVLRRDDLARATVEPGMYVLSDVFRLHMEFLKERFETLSLPEALDRWETGSIDPRRAYCVITFDDGWLDTYREAFPILREYGLPATVFLATDFVGTTRRFWTDDLVALLDQYTCPTMPAGLRSRVADVLGAYGLEVGTRGGMPDVGVLIERCKEQSPEVVASLLEDLGRPFDGPGERQRVFVDWDEVREMSRHGISFGSHSASHRILSRLDPSEVRQDVEASTAGLRRPGVARVEAFCYPNGGYNATVIEVVRRVGYRAAVTTDFGVEGLTPEDPFRLRRIGVHNDISASRALFAVRVAGLR